MRQITINVYQFDELSDEAKQNAINELSNINVDGIWWDIVYEDARQIGVEIKSFELDRNLHCIIEPQVSAQECAANIIREHGSSCDTFNVATNFIEAHNEILANYMDEEHEDYESSECEDQMLELEEVFLCELANEYANMLQREHDYLVTDEAIIETIKANEYEFDKNGNFI